MQKLFIPYCISCLDESISVRMKKITFPGFVFFPHKPHPKDNKYQTICCGESGIMYGWEIVKGWDHTIPMGKPEFETSPNMKTVGLILQLKILLWIIGKAVIMDSGFCVLKGIRETNKRGVYGSALIKKRRYWPTGVHGYSINNYFR